MLTCKEHLENYSKEEKRTTTAWKKSGLFVHGLDLAKHCLKKDTGQSMWKASATSTGHFREFSKAFNSPPKMDRFEEIQENALTQSKKWREQSDYEGDLDVQAYIAQDELCFNSVRRVDRQKSAVSIVFEMAVPWHARDDNDMERRHEKIYNLCFQLENERRPVRVLCAYGAKFPELKFNLPVFVLIKDYTDPIFPGIWGALRNNKTTNDFINVINDYFLGTRCGVNGKMKHINIAPFMPEGDEINLIDPNWLSEK